MTTKVLVHNGHKAVEIHLFDLDCTLGIEKWDNTAIIRVLPGDLGEVYATDTRKIVIVEPPNTLALPKA